MLIINKEIGFLCSVNLASFIFHIPRSRKEALEFEKPSCIEFVYLPDNTTTQQNTNTAWLLY
jgi:hypothetical protein